MLIYTHKFKQVKSGIDNSIYTKYEISLSSFKNIQVSTVITNYLSSYAQSSEITNTIVGYTNNNMADNYVNNSSLFHISSCQHSSSDTHTKQNDYLTTSAVIQQKPCLYFKFNNYVR